MRPIVLIAAALASAALLSAPAAAKDVIIHAGRLIDGVSKQPRDRVSILVRDDRIAAVTSGFSEAPGAQVIDLSNATVLPGLIDCHDHITLQSDGGDPVAEMVTRTRSDLAFRSVNYARAELEAGFTSIRDVGGDTELVVALKRAVASGVIPGPRMWVSGAPLSPTGGHGDPSNGLDPELSHPQWGDGVIDSPEEAVRAVRTLRKRGADLVKIMPSGGVLSIGDNPSLQLMSDAEIKAVIETAHALGMKVAAHAHGKQAIDHAIELGVDSIEHGSYADADSYRLFKQHGTYLVPTLLAAQSALEEARDHPEHLRPSSAAKALAVAPILLAHLGDAYRAGVKIAFGTDVILAPHGSNAREFSLLVKAGMTPMDAIVAATSSAADLIGAPDDIGSIQPGRYADIIAVSGDPLADVSELERVKFVMQGGRIYKDAIGTSAR